MYQVQEYFLPEVMDRLQEAGIRHHRQSVNLGDEAEKPETDHDLVVDVVKYLDQVKPPVSISFLELCNNIPVYMQAYMWKKCITHLLDSM